MPRMFALFAALMVLFWSPMASAAVEMSFHSFNGSLFGRYPHTFVVLEGTMEDGTAVNENYGFSARNITPAILSGPVKHIVMVEKPKYVRSTNRHFTVTLDDAQVGQVRATMAQWRDAPGKYYDLGSRNCIHFVGAMAQIAGLKVDYPEKLLRKPKSWLNRVAALNPQLGARKI
ncbi:MAG: hypothetical protein WA954_12450 [Parerythrobacter sp.]